MFRYIAVRRGKGARQLCRVPTVAEAATPLLEGPMRQISLREFRTRGFKALESVRRVKRYRWRGRKVPSDEQIDLEITCVRAVRNLRQRA